MNNSWEVFILHFQLLKLCFDNFYDHDIVYETMFVILICR